MTATSGALTLPVNPTSTRGFRSVTEAVRELLSELESPATVATTRNEYVPGLLPPVSQDSDAFSDAPSASDATVPVTSASVLSLIYTASEMLAASTLPRLASVTAIFAASPMITGDSGTATAVSATSVTGSGVGVGVGVGSGSDATARMLIMSVEVALLLVASASEKPAGALTVMVATTASLLVAGCRLRSHKKPPYFVSPAAIVHSLEQVSPSSVL